MYIEFYSRHNPEFLDSGASLVTSGSRKEEDSINARLRKRYGEDLRSLFSDMPADEVIAEWATAVPAAEMLFLRQFRDASVNRPGAVEIGIKRLRGAKKLLNEALKNLKNYEGTVQEMAQSLGAAVKESKLQVKHAKKILEHAKQHGVWNVVEGWGEELLDPTACHGVTVHDGHIRSINLAHMQIMGTLPASIGNLTCLERLWLCNNELYGEIPESIGQCLDSLKYLNLSDNQFSGFVPRALCRRIPIQSHTLRMPQPGPNLAVTCQKLFLSHLCIHIMIGMVMTRAITSMGCLKVMDLRWNYLHCPTDLLAAVEAKSYTSPEGGDEEKAAGARGRRGKGGIEEKESETGTGTATATSTKGIRAAAKLAAKPLGVKSGSTGLAATSLVAAAKGSGGGGGMAGALAISALATLAVTMSQAEQQRRKMGLASAEERKIHEAALHQQQQTKLSRKQVERVRIKP